MQHGQPAAHILPLRRGKPMKPEGVDDFPKDIQDFVYDIIAGALIRHEQEHQQEEAS